MSKGFYCTLRRDTANGTKAAWLLGPFDTHEEATDRVREAFDKACDLDPRCVWDAYGTASIEIPGDAPLPAGKLNAFFGLPTDAEKKSH